MRLTNRFLIEPVEELNKIGLLPYLSDQDTTNKPTTAVKIVPINPVIIRKFAACGWTNFSKSEIALSSIPEPNKEQLDSLYPKVT